MTRLKTVNIKGKSYVEVKERLKYFRENFKDYSLESELIELTDESVVFKAVIRNPQGRVLATGFAQDYKNSSYINKTSYIENCETSAWGRCLGNFGIGIDSSVATYEEVSNAIASEQHSKTAAVENAVKKTFNAKPVQSEKSMKPFLTNEDETKWQKAIVYVFENSMSKLKEYYAISKQDEERLSLEVWSYMKTLAVEKGVDYVFEKKQMSEEMQKELIDSIYSDYEEEEQYDTYLEHIAQEYHNQRG